MSIRSLRVCVVDDDPISLRIISAVIRGLGHDVTTRGQALGSLSAIVRDRPDVVVLDLSMPGLSGVGLGDLIRETNQRTGRRVAIVVCSGETKEAVESAARSVGATGAICKSANPDALRKAFQAVLSGIALELPPT